LCRGDEIAQIDSEWIVVLGRLICHSWLQWASL
jgi:hypothetical protein